MGIFYQMFYLDDVRAGNPALVTSLACIYGDLVNFNDLFNYGKIRPPLNRFLHSFKKSIRSFVQEAQDLNDAGKKWLNLYIYPLCLYKLSSARIAHPKLCRRNASENSKTISLLCYETLVTVAVNSSSLRAAQISAADKWLFHHHSKCAPLSTNWRSQTFTHRSMRVHCFEDTTTRAVEHILLASKNIHLIGLFRCAIMVCVNWRVVSEKFVRKLSVHFFNPSELVVKITHT